MKEYLDGIRSLILEQRIPTDNKYAVIVFCTGCAIMGILVFVIDILMYRIKGNSLLWSKDNIRLKHSIRTSPLLLLAWIAGSFFVGYIGKLTTLVQASALSCVIIGVLWPYIFTRILDTLWTEEEYQKPTKGKGDIQESAQGGINLSDFFEGRSEFEDDETIMGFVSNSKNFDLAKEASGNPETLLLFNTSKQKTWLIATTERLYCILDDIRKNRPHINWSISRAGLISENRVIAEITVEYYKRRTGIVHIAGTRGDWLYSKRLFKRIPVDTAIGRLIKTKMSDQQN